MSILAQPIVIEGLTLVIGVLGLLLVSMLFFEVRQAHEHNKLKRHRATDEGFVDLLNYAAVVDDGVIICKNGAFMAAWLYQGDDNASSTDEQREMTSLAHQSGDWDAWQRICDPRGRNTAQCTRI